MLRTRTTIATLVMIGGFSLPLAATSSARAGLIPNKADFVAEGDNYRWTYQVVVTSDLYVSKGDYFTIYDFAGAKEGATTYNQDLWDMSVGLKTPVPNRPEYGNIDPKDDPSIPNYTFKYKGDSTIVGSALLGNFSFLTPYNFKADSVFTSVNHRIDNTTTGPDPQEFNLTPTVVAVSTEEPPPTAEEPEPATIIIAGAALPVLLARRFRRRSK